MNIELKEQANGYIVVLDNDIHKSYVFKFTESLSMLEFIGKYIHGRKVKVVEN